MSAARAFGFAAALLTAGTYIGVFAPHHVTVASFNDPQLSEGSFVASIPIGTGCVFWANSTIDPHALKIRGGNHSFEGCVHSNSVLELQGNTHTFNRTLRYASTYANNSNGHDVRRGVVPVPAEPYPFPFTLADYAPGGRAAQAAQAHGKYFTYAGNVKLSDSTLREGLHFVQGVVSIDSNSATRRITVVSTGSMSFTGAAGNLTSYIDGLLLFTNSPTNNALSFTGQDNTLRGALYAIRGGISFTSNNNTYYGQVVGATIDISGQGSKFYAARASALAQGIGPGGIAMSPPPALVAVRPLRDPGSDVRHNAPIDVVALVPAFVGTGDFNGDGSQDVAVGVGDIVITPSDALIGALP